jgi:hypothetical protein
MHSVAANVDELARHRIGPPVACQQKILVQSTANHRYDN